MLLKIFLIGFSNIAASFWQTSHEIFLERFHQNFSCYVGLYIKKITIYFEVSIYLAGVNVLLILHEFISIKYIEILRKFDIPL